MQACDGREVWYHHGCYLTTSAQETKLMRRAPHTFNKGSALDQMDQIET